MRKLVRLVVPGGWIVVATPNQLSLFSLATLVIKHRFQAFQDIHYPTHLTALLEIDLRRMAAECDLENVAVEYSGSGRIPYHCAPLSTVVLPEMAACTFGKCASDWSAESL
jgi:hypothetical protein